MRNVVSSTQGSQKNASTLKIKQGCGSVNNAVWQPSAPHSFNWRYPTSLKGARASEATIHAHGMRVPQVPQKRSSHIFRSFRPLRSYALERRRCTASVLSPVSPLFYDRRFRRPQRHRAKPIPLSNIYKEGVLEWTTKTLKVQSLHSELRPRKECGSKNIPTVITVSSAILFGIAYSKKTSLSSKVSMNSQTNYGASVTI